MARDPDSQLAAIRWKLALAVLVYCFGPFILALFLFLGEIRWHSWMLASASRAMIVIARIWGAIVVAVLLAEMGRLLAIRVRPYLITAMLPAVVTVLSLSVDGFQEYRDFAMHAAERGQFGALTSPGNWILALDFLSVPVAAIAVAVLYSKRLPSIRSVTAG